MTATLFFCHVGENQRLSSSHGDAVDVVASVVASVAVGTKQIDWNACCVGDVKIQKTKRSRCHS